VLGEQGALSPAEKGTAVHAVMQFIDFSRCGDEASVRGEIARLLTAGHLTPAQAAAADPALILAFFRSPLGRRVLSADQVWRELRFSLLVGAEDLFDVPPGERILLQGVADCCIREGDALTVVDYKTDYVNPSSLAEKGRLYAPQLRAYAAAMERVLGLPVRECDVFFLRSGLCWKVEPKKK
jgi:ATP-dependent helicase/nuclease subunit A